MTLLTRASALYAEASAAVPAELLQLLQTAKRLWVIPHERPDADAVLGLIVQKSTQQKRYQSQQNGFDCSGARTPIIRCTIGTMYH